MQEESGGDMSFDHKMVLHFVRLEQWFSKCKICFPKGAPELELEKGRKQRVECRRTCKLANLHGKKQHDHDYIHFPVLVCFHLSADTWSVLVPSLYTIYSFHWFICACSDSLVKTVAYYLCRPHEVTQLQIQLDWISSVVLTRANQNRPNLAVINWAWDFMIIFIWFACSLKPHDCHWILPVDAGPTFLNVPMTI